MCIRDRRRCRVDAQHAVVSRDVGVPQAHLLGTAQLDGGVLPAAWCVVAHEVAFPLIPSSGRVHDAGHGCYLLTPPAPSRSSPPACIAANSRRSPVVVVRGEVVLRTLERGLELPAPLDAEASVRGELGQPVANEVVREPGDRLKHAAVSYT